MSMWMSRQPTTRVLALMAGLAMAWPMSGVERLASAGMPALEADLEEPVLLYRFDARPQPGSMLEVDVSVDGARQARERWSLPAAAQKQPIYELFARAPKRLAEWQAQANAGHSVMVTLTLDGRVVASLPLADLLGSSQALRRQGVVPEDLSGDVVPAAGVADAELLGPVTNNACGDACRADRLTCLADCNETPSPSCRADCDRWHTKCMEACNEPPNCPTTTTQTRWQVLSYSFRGFICYGAGTPGAQALEYWRYWKVSTVQVTTACDGSETENVTSVAYVTDLCAWPQGSCSNPTNSTPIFWCHFS